MPAFLVASSGGHLAQLHHLRPRLEGLDGGVVWVTFDTPQSRSLLAGEDVIYVDHMGSRDYRHVMTNGLQASRLLREREVTTVVSTGAAIALSFLPLARARGVDCHYIESATRSHGPSTTGRLLAHVPGISLYTQHPGWETGRWRYAGSVFDGYMTRPRRFPTRTIRSAVVTLGAHRGFGFRRLLERLVNILPREAEILWQTGATDVRGLDIEARPQVPGHELSTAIGEADVVIAHAGIGATMSAFDAGRCPVLVPRRVAFGEHVDDHQREIASHLARGDLAVVREVPDLEPDDLLDAAGRRIVRADPLALFRLLGPVPGVPAPVAPVSA